MAKLTVKKASTDVTVYIFIQDYTSTLGGGLTGLTFETASLVASYVRPLAARAALTLATQTVDGAHSDGGFVEVDATNMPGVYRLDLPDAVCATGVNSVVVMLKGAANMAPVLIEIQLSSYDPNDAVRLGITALPNAAADAAGGLPISDAGGLDLDAQIKTNINEILADTGTDGVKVAAVQGAITWGQQKITANVAGEGALHISNNNALGTGMRTYGGEKGQSNVGNTSHGLQNYSSGGGAGQINSSASGIGQINSGKPYGQQNIGTTKPVVGFDTLIATAANLATVDGVVDSILDDTGTNIPAAVAAVDSDVWSYSSRTLTQSAASVTAAVTGSDITCQRGDTLSAALTDVGALTGYSKIYFTVKQDSADADSASIIQIEKTDGLKYLNGAAAGTAANGSITIVDEATGDITIALDEVETAKLNPGSYSYDVQIVRTAGTVSTLTAGTFEVAADITRAVT